MNRPDVMSISERQSRHSGPGDNKSSPNDGAKKGVLSITCPKMDKGLLQG